MFNDLNNWKITKIIRNLEDLSRQKKNDDDDDVAAASFITKCEFWVSSGDQKKASKPSFHCPGPSETLGKIR